ncbi:MAG TPA: hypothetical protein VMW89_06715 [Desulfatiglandales bacterium]|nr:hypothetical protein [Desulfatiglandales bacterium]
MYRAFSLRALISFLDPSRIEFWTPAASILQALLQGICPVIFLITGKANHLSPLNATSCCLTIFNHGAAVSSYGPKFA